MNTGAEAVETAIKAAPQVGLYGQEGTCQQDQAEILVFDQQLPWPHHDHRRLLHRRPVQGWIRSVHTGLPRCWSTVTPTRCHGGNARECGRHPDRAHPGRRWHHHSARRLPEARCGQLWRTSTTHCLVMRRDPERARTDGQDVRLRARGDIRPDIVIVGKALSGGFYPRIRAFSPTTP